MHNWCLEVWGDYACFTRPEMKVERVSYDIITPSAGRAIFEAILWKPAMKWNITKIEILNPIKWVSVRRNEVGEKIGPNMKNISIEDNRVQRMGYFLRDVRYRIHGYFDYIPPEKRTANRPASREYFVDGEEGSKAPIMDESEAKYAAMFERRARKGQCFHRPYFGTREFACFFKLVDENSEQAAPIDETRDLGYMLYDMDFTKDPSYPIPLFFKAKIVKGVVTIDTKTVRGLV